MSTTASVTDLCRQHVCQSFCPSITITSSPDADKLCQSLGAPSLLHLLKPYSKVSGRITVRDSQAMSKSFDDFTVKFLPGILQRAGQAIHGDSGSSHSSAYNAADSTMTRATAHLPPSASEPDLTNLTIKDTNTSPLGTGNQLFDVNDLESLIADQLNANANDESIYMSMFRHVAKPASHQGPTSFETFNHPVAEVIAVSCANSQPIETLSQLYKHSTEHIPPWVDPAYLRYYLLMYDESSKDLEKSVALFEKVKRSFGLHCHMIKVRSPDADSEPSAALSIETVDAIRTFVRELTVQSAIPFMERNIALWNDQIASSRRGIAGRLFSARKYFSSSRNNTLLSATNVFGQAFNPLTSPASAQQQQQQQHSGNDFASINGNYNSKSLSYPATSPEAQLRKLADFAFMLRDFKCAYNTYELLKKDYHRDKAWPYLAACQEMAAISYLMSTAATGPSLFPHSRSSSLANAASSDPNSDLTPTSGIISNGPSLLPLGLSPKTRIDLLDPLLDSAVYSYISRSSLPTYALRAILICSELLCGQLSPSAASEGATHWILKALNERLAGRLAYALIMERMACAYSAHDSNIALIKQLLAVPGPLSSSSSTSPGPQASGGGGGTTPSPSPQRSSSRIKDDIRKEAFGASRQRKVALWNLLSAREWYEAKQMHRAKFCLDQADSILLSLPWTQSTSVLLGRLKSDLSA